MVRACCSGVSSPAKLKSMAGISSGVGAEYLIALADTMGGPRVLPVKKLNSGRRSAVLHRGFMESPCRRRQIHIFIQLTGKLYASAEPVKRQELYRLQKCIPALKYAFQQK